MKIIYFANLKEVLGFDEEHIIIDRPQTVREIVQSLTKRSKKHRIIFKDVSKIFCAVNCNFSNFDHTVTNSDELAFFPPVTGG